MQMGSVLEDNGTQIVRLPVDMRFDDGVKKVLVRKEGRERILTPVKNTWDDFFLEDQRVSDDFLPERASQK